MLKESQTVSATRLYEVAFFWVVLQNRSHEEMLQRTIFFCRSKIFSYCGDNLHFLQFFTITYSLLFECLDGVYFVSN